MDGIEKASGAGVSEALVVVLPGDRVRELAEEAVNALDVSPASRETYRRGLRPFLAFWERRGWESPSRALVLDFKRSLEERGLSPFSVSGALSAVRAFFRHLEALGVAPDVTRNVKGPRKPRGFSRDYLTDSEVRATLDAIPRDTRSGLRDFALVNLLGRTGIRTIEAIRADVGDVQTQGSEKVLRVHRKGHGGKDDAVLLVPEAHGPLLAYLALRQGVREDAPLFASESDRNAGGRLTTRTVRNIVEECMKAAGVKRPRVTAHSLRHTFGTLTQAAGAPTLRVRDAMGHASVATTETYVHALDRFGPDAAERYFRLPGDGQE